MPWTKMIWGPADLDSEKEIINLSGVAGKR